MDKYFYDRNLKTLSNSCDECMCNDIDEQYDYNTNYNNTEWNDYVNDYYENYVAKY